MSALDQTGTLWVILMTPKKNLLAKVSSLKKFGKIKIEELKVMYGRKGIGGWIFQVLGQPQSRTFSFHDGEVVQKTNNGYLPLRKNSIRIYYVISIACLLWFSGVIVHQFFTTTKVAPPVAAVEEVEPEAPKLSLPKLQKKVEAPVRLVDPQSHQYFLEAKRDFQYGKMTSSLKILKQHMAGFDEADRVAANEMLSEMFFLQCEKFKSQHEQRKAVIACEKATSYSEHTRANAFLNAQEEKARQLYMEGYTAVKFSPAIAKQKFALVLQAAKTKSTWRGKAQYQLRKFKNQTP